MLFKDHLVARTFRVSLGWITRLGVFLTGILVVCLLSFFFALKYYHAAHRADPLRVQALEQQLSDLQANYLTLQEAQKNAAASAPLPQTTSTSNATTAIGTAQPIPTVTVTVTATPATSAAPAVSTGASVPLTGANFLFSALAPSTLRVEGKPNVGVTHAKLSWMGHTLRLRFNIQYLNEDKGSQQGRIILLARGPDSLLGYPQGVFKQAGQTTLLSPESGEYFSVSRVRETKADFGPVNGGADLREVEILLISLDGKILVHERFEAPAAPKARPKPSPPPTSEKADAPAASNEAGTAPTSPAAPSAPTNSTTDGETTQ